MTFEPDSFEFLLDSTTGHFPTIGLRINAANGAVLTIPMTSDTAADVGGLLLAHAHQANRSESVR